MQGARPGGAPHGSAVWWSYVPMAATFEVGVLGHAMGRVCQPPTADSSRVLHVLLQRQSTCCCAWLLQMNKAQTLQITDALIQDWLNTTVGGSHVDVSHVDAVPDAVRCKQLQPWLHPPTKAKPHPCFHAFPPCAGWRCVELTGGAVQSCGLASWQIKALALAAFQQSARLRTPKARESSHTNSINTTPPIMS